MGVLNRVVKKKEFRLAKAWSKESVAVMAAKSIINAVAI
jgi:hypothetical protein